MSKPFGGPWERLLWCSGRTWGYVNDGREQMPFRADDMAEAKRFTDAELAAEYWAEHERATFAELSMTEWAMDRSARRADEMTRKLHNSRQVNLKRASTLCRFATHPSYDEAR